MTTQYDEANTQPLLTQSLLRSKIINNRELVAPNYKPRYMVEETKLVESNDSNNIFSPRCIISTLCCQCCCFKVRGLSRRKILIIMGVASLLCCLVNIYILRPLATTLDHFHTFALARKQSFGLFDDVTNEHWISSQAHVYDQRTKNGGKMRGVGASRFSNLFSFLKKGNQNVILQDPSHYSDASQFYSNHWHTEFTCPHEERVGYDEARSKYLCNPRRIYPASQYRVKHGGNGCIIYTSAANVNEFSFEKALMDILRQKGNVIKCDIHVFSPNKNFKEESLPEGVQFHPWGFSGTTMSETNNDEVVEFKTISDTLKSLGHCGSTIDVLSIDCEGCEFDIYKDLFSLSKKNVHCTKASFMQILVQVHGAPSGKTNEFFTTFQDDNFVVFHKEARTETGGNEQEYGFLKLSAEFFI